MEKKKRLPLEEKKAQIANSDLSPNRALIPERNPIHPRPSATRRRRRPAGVITSITAEPTTTTNIPPPIRPGPSPRRRPAPQLVLQQAHHAEPLHRARGPHRLRQHPRPILDPAPLDQPGEHVEPLRADGGQQRRGIHHAAAGAHDLLDQPEGLVVFDRDGEGGLIVMRGGSSSGGVGVVVEEEGWDERVAAAAGPRETGDGGGAVRESGVVLVQEREGREVRVCERGREDEFAGDVRAGVCR